MGDVWRKAHNPAKGRGEIMSSCRNRLWKKDKHGDVTVLSGDGSVIKVVPISVAKLNTPSDKEEILNERQNERYAEWREAVLKRDRKTCVLCGEKQWIQVHHISRWADNKAKRYDLQNGVCLCIPCHTKHHGQAMEAFPAEITEQLIRYISALYGESTKLHVSADKSIPALRSSVAEA